MRPRVGKNHAIHCIEAYQDQLLGRGVRESAPDVSFAGLLRTRSLVPVISDFLFEDPHPLLAELADLNASPVAYSRRASRRGLGFRTGFG